MKKRIRFFSFLLAGVVFFVLLFSVVFIAAEAEHDCSGHGCAVCAQIAACKERLETISLAVGIQVLCLFLRNIVVTTEKSRTMISWQPTLVRLKVKLSN